MTAHNQSETPTMTSDEVKALLDLAERCEKATGPDVVLTQDIADFAESIGLLSIGMFIPDYTASIDAAMTLVPSAHYWSAGTSAQDGYEHYDDMDYGWAQVVHRERGEQINCDAAATPALALCAAALRARASIEGATRDQR